MKLPNWFKIVWWIVLLVVLTTYLGDRYSDLRFGRSIPIDVVVFLVWFGLLLAPLFNEVNFFGMKLKQEVEALRRDFFSQVQTLKSEIQNTVQVSPTITIAPPDSHLPKLEEEIKSLLDQKLKEYGVSPKSQTIGEVEGSAHLPDDVSFLFAVRYSIEKELRRIAKAEMGIKANGLGVSRLLNVLLRAEILDSELAQIIRQVYAVSSSAIHGDEVSEAKVKFVRDVTPELLTTLRHLTKIAEMQLGPLIHPKQPPPS